MGSVVSLCDRQKKYICPVYITEVGHVTALKKTHLVQLETLFTFAVVSLH